MLQFTNNKLSAHAEAIALHRPKTGGQGFFCLAVKGADPKAGKHAKAKGFHQSFYNVGAIDQALMAATQNQRDWYISQASYIREHRGNAMVHRISCAFVDLDIYRLNLTATDEVIQRVSEIALQHNFPPPSYVTKSGRGLYAKWVFDSPIPASEMPAWNKLQHILISIMGPLGADPSARDGARVLRIPGTINSKGGDHVEAMAIAGSMYSFKTLCEQASRIQINQESVKKTRERRVITQIQEDLSQLSHAGNLSMLDDYINQKSPLALGFSQKQQLSWSRFLDLRNLFNARDGIKEGMRDISAFWMADFLSHSGIITADSFDCELRNLLSSFPSSPDFDPINDGSMGSLLRRIKMREAGEKVVYDNVAYDPVYTISNDSLINLFEISDSEMESMTTIISTSEKRRRADAKAPGRAERRSEREECRFAAVALRDLGKTIDEICVEVKRSKSTVYRWLQKDESVDRPYIETRGRRSLRPQSHAKYRITGSGLKPIEPQECITKSTQLSMKELKRRTKLRQPHAHHRQDHQWSQQKVEDWLAKRHAARRLERENAMRAKLCAIERDAANRKNIPQATDELTNRLAANMAALLAKRVISNSVPQCVSSDVQSSPYRERQRI